MKPVLLIVDDDELILEVYGDYFRQNQFDVKTAATVDQALRLIHQTPIHVILSDVVMPRKNGFDLYNEVHSIRPQIRFVFMTGYEHDPVVIERLESLNAPWLPKPAQLHQLLQLVQSVLSAEPTSDHT